LARKAFLDAPPKRRLLGAALESGREDYVTAAGNERSPIPDSEIIAKAPFKKKDDSRSSSRVLAFRQRESFLLFAVFLRQSGRYV